MCSVPPHPAGPRRFLIAVLAAATAAACSGPATVPAPFVSPLAAASAPVSCHARGTEGYVLPDPACTPGATNSEVTPATVATTVCHAGWTATVRPPESYTQRIKREQMQAYGWTGPLSDYEEDHLDRKSVVEGKSVDLGGGGLHK